MASDEARMASKRFRGKACAYCAEPGSATVGEHVLARSFLPIADRDNIPKVPACEACNGAKEKVEDYARTLVLLGGRHPRALDFLAADLERRARRRPQHLLALGKTTERAWERTAGRIALPTAAVTVNTAAMLDFYTYLTKGLFHHHVGAPLQSDAIIRPRMLPVAEEAVFLSDMASAFGRDVRHVAGDIGQGVLRYRGALSTLVIGATSWWIDLGGMRWAIGAETPHTLVSRMHVSTVPPMAERAEELSHDKPGSPGSRDQAAGVG